MLPDQIYGRRTGKLGNAQQKLSRRITAEIREGFEQLLGGGLRARVGGAHLQVLLDQRGVDGGRYIPWVLYSAQRCNVEHNDDDAGDGERNTGVPAFPDTDADEPKSVDCGDDKGEPIGSGNGSQPNQDRIIDLGYAQEIPWKPRDAGAS